MTLVEILVTVLLVSIVVAIAMVTYGDKTKKALLAACQADLRSIQSTVLTYYVVNERYPTQDELWNSGWHGHRPGPYFYLLDHHLNHGQGVNLHRGGSNEGGHSPGGPPDIDFVVLCQHDHGDLAHYVYAVNLEPPVLAKDGDDPRYDTLLGSDRPGNSGSAPGHGAGH